MAKIFWPTLKQLQQMATDLGMRQVAADANPNPDSLSRKELLQAIIRIKKQRIRP